jgi:hypothetical protein
LKPLNNRFVIKKPLFIIVNSCRIAAGLDRPETPLLSGTLDMTNMKGRRTSSSANNSAEAREAQQTMFTVHQTANSTLCDHSAQRAVSWQIRHSASLRQGSLDNSFELAKCRHFNVTSQG